MRLARRQLVILTAHALVGWALCGAIIAVGFAVTTERAALIAHAAGAPIVFALVTAVYYRYFGFTTPLQTAACCLSTVMAMDFFVVSLLINGDLRMFASVLGTWLPFALLFAASYLVGLLFTSRGPTRAAA